MKFMIGVLKKYEATSGQMINLDKSAFYVHDKVARRVVSGIKALTRIRQGFFFLLTTWVFLFFMVGTKFAIMTPSSRR